MKLTRRNTVTGALNRSIQNSAGIIGGVLASPNDLLYVTSVAIREQLYGGCLGWVIPNLVESVEENLPCFSELALMVEAVITKVTDSFDDGDVGFVEKGSVIVDFFEVDLRAWHRPDNFLWRNLFKKPYLDENSHSSLSDVGRVPAVLFMPWRLLAKELVNFTTPLDLSGVIMFSDERWSLLGHATPSSQRKKIRLKEGTGDGV